MSKISYDPRLQWKNEPSDRIGGNIIKIRKRYTGLLRIKSLIMLAATLTLLLTMGSLVFNIAALYFAGPAIFMAAFLITLPPLLIGFSTFISLYIVAGLIEVLTDIAKNTARSGEILYYMVKTVRGKKGE